MTTADKLRGLMEGATKYLESHGPDHDDGCSEDDTCNCETGRNQRDLDRIVRVHPAMAAVVEAASGIDPRCECESLRGHESDDVVCDSCKLKSALSALDALAPELKETDHAG